MQKVRTTSWENLTYRDVQRELAAQNSIDKYKKSTSSFSEENLNTKPEKK